jgi:hypothetical protein
MAVKEKDDTCWKSTSRRAQLIDSLLCIVGGRWRLCFVKPDVGRVQFVT